MTVWQWLHFRFGLPKPLFEPLAVERLYLDNYFSIAKAERDLGYRPLFTTDQAMGDCLPYYTRALRADEGSDHEERCRWRLCTAAEPAA